MVTNSLAESGELYCDFFYNLLHLPYKTYKLVNPTNIINM